MCIGNLIGIHFYGRHQVALLDSHNAVKVG